MTDPDGIGRRRQIRGALLALAAVVCGGLAAERVRDTVQEVESRTGSPVPVVVAARDLPEGFKVGVRQARRALALRKVPARYAPRDALAAAEQALGLELVVPAALGSYVTAGMLRDPLAGRPAAARVARGERQVEVAVTGGRELTVAPGPVRVDVLVTKEGRAGGGRTFVALENVALLAARPLRGAEIGDALGRAPDTLATLRVGARAAVYLTAAQNFAREVRLLVRPAGDRRPVGRAEACSTGLDTRGLCR